jgi:hypothetical protein
MLEKRASFLATIALGCLSTGEDIGSAAASLRSNKTDQGVALEVDSARVI